MEKELYEPMILEVVSFDSDDVIQTSEKVLVVYEPEYDDHPKYNDNDTELFPKN